MAAHLKDLTKTKHKTAFTALAPVFSYTNPMQGPKISKVVVSIGIGSVSDKNKRALIRERLAELTGQEPADRAAKKSISTYKTRVGDVIGYQVTLRGERMWAFLDKLLHIALPRTRDFRGLKTSGFDAIGNFSMGIREHTVFPEAGDEDIKDVFGLGITVVTTAKTAQEAEALLRHVGFPFEKEGAR